jgi:TP901 family phage tail tape measure protein
MSVRADILAGRAVILVNIQDTIDKQLRTIRSKMRVFSNSLSEIGGDLFRGGVAGTFAAFFPVKQFVDFQDSILFLQSKLRNTKVDIVELEAYIRKLGRTTSFTSKQVAETAAVLAQAGLDEKLRPAILPTLDLARSERVEPDVAGRILANVLSSFDLAAEKAQETASKLATAARLGTTDLVLLGESLKYNVTTFRQLNIPLEDALGMITMLSNAGMRGSLAGTSLNTAFGELVTKTKELAKVGSGVYITEQDIAEPLRVLVKLKAAMSELSATEQQETLRKLFNIRGARGIGGQTIQDLKTLDDITKEIRNSTDEARQGAILMDSRLGGVFRRASSALEEFSISLGQTTEGPLTTFGTSIQRLFDSLAVLTQQNSRLGQAILFTPPAVLATSAAFLLLSTTISKVIMLFSPLLGVNKMFFTSLAAIVGVNVKALKGMFNYVGFINAAINKTLETQKKVANSIKQVQDKIGKFQASARTRTTSLEQRNQNKLAQLDRSFADKRVAVQRESNQKIDEISKKNRVAAAELSKKQRDERTKLKDRLKKTENELTQNVVNNAKEAQKAQQMQIKQQNSYDKQLFALQNKQYKERIKLSADYKTELKSILSEISQVRSQAAKTDMLMLTKAGAKLREKQATLEKQASTLVKGEKKKQIALAKNQAKELVALQGQQTQAFSRYANKSLSAEQNLLKAQDALQKAKVNNAVRIARMDKIQQKTLQVAREKAGLTPGTFLAGTYGKSPDSLKRANDIESKLLMKQGVQRRNLLNRNNAVEAQLAQRVRKSQAKLNADLKLEKSKQPKGFLGFLTKERSDFNLIPDLVAGLGKLESGLTGVKNIITGATKVDWVRGLYGTLKGSISLIKGVFSGLVKIASIPFRLSGLIAIGEFLLLFGDKIPVVREALGSLGAAFAGAFANIGQTIKNTGAGFSEVFGGLTEIFNGEIDPGLRSISFGFNMVGESIREGLAKTWRDFLTEIEPGATMIRNAIVGVIAVFNQLLSVIGTLFGTAVGGAGLAITADKSLVETMQSMFSPENFQAFFAHIVGFIESIGSSLVSVIGMAASALAALGRGFAAMLRYLPGTEDSVAALDPQTATRNELLDEQDSIRAAIQGITRSGGQITPELAGRLQEIEAKLATMPDPLIAFLDDAQKKIKEAADKARETIGTMTDSIVPMNDLEKEFGRITTEGLPSPSLPDDITQGITDEFTDIGFADKMDPLLNLGPEFGNLLNNLEEYNKLFPQLDESAMKPDLNPEWLKRVAQMQGTGQIIKSIVGGYEQSRAQRMQLQVNKLDEERNELLQGIKDGIENQEPAVFGP